MSTSPAKPPTDVSRSRRVQRRFSRRGFVGTAAATTGMSLLSGLVPANASAASVGSTASQRTRNDIGSVSTAPKLPAGFTRTFKSRFVQANGIRQHVVIGGAGPPLLLVHGWPENWYAWRFLMPALARDFTVIAADQRGIGLTEGPRDGYDAATLADDLAELMTELGHQRFAVVGHDTGYIISYALAADHRDRVDRLVVAEIPGPPGVSEAPGLFVPEILNNKLWHIPFNRVNDNLIVDMVSSNAAAYYRYEFAIQGGGATLPDYAIEYYINLYTRSKNVLRASFGLYRAWDATLKQNEDRKETLLTIPVLGIGGANSWGAAPAGEMTNAASDVETVVIPGTGHWVAERAPAEMREALGNFLAPYLKAAG